MLRVFNIPRVLATGLVLNANRNSTAIQLYNTLYFAIQIVITGTPTGTVKLQGSCDPAAAAVSGGNPTTVNSPTNWTDIPNATTAVSAAGSVLFNIQEVGYNWVRVAYVDGSAGASTAVIASAVFNGKGA